MSIARAGPMEKSHRRSVLYVCIYSMREKTKKIALTEKNKKKERKKGMCCYCMKNQRHSHSSAKKRIFDKKK